MRAACANGGSTILQLLLEQQPPLSASELSQAFIEACGSGSLSTVQVLLALTGEQRVDVHYNNDEALQQALRRGRSRDVVMELLDLQGDRYIELQVDRHVRFVFSRPAWNRGSKLEAWRSAVLTRVLARMSPSMLDAALPHAHDPFVFERLLKDPRLRWSSALRTFVEKAACTESDDLATVKQLLLSGSDRLPPRKVYEAQPRLMRELGPYDRWCMHWRNRPRAVRLVEWRAGLEAKTGWERVQRCCEDGRPLELDRSLRVLGGERAMDEGTRRRWRTVARDRGHDECVRVLDSFGDGPNDAVDVTGTWCCFLRCSAMVA